MTPFRVYDFNQYVGNLVFFFLIWRKYKDLEGTNFWTLCKERQISSRDQWGWRWMLDVALNLGQYGWKNIKT